MLPLMKIYAATGNKGKLAEFVRSASARGIEVLALPGLADMPEPVEDGATIKDNAAIKAIAYSRMAPDEFVLADDSGLEVEALDGEPGVRSARYAEDRGFGEGSSLTKDERNNWCLLEKMQGVTNRRARFVCHLAVAMNGSVCYADWGEVQGELLNAPQGEEGFGYDPLFLLPERGKTMAELTPEEKWQISHRGNAFRSLVAGIVPDWMV